MASNKSIEYMRGVNTIRLQNAFAGLILAMAFISFCFFCYFSCTKEYRVAGMFVGGDFVILSVGWKAVVSHLFGKQEA